MSVGKKIVKGAAVLTSMRLAIRLVGLLSTLVLARVLVPDDFGLVGLAVSYLAIIEGIVALNLNSALIRFRDDRRDLYDTAWTLGVIRGILIAGFVFTSGLFVPDAMDEPRLEILIYIISIIPILQGLKNPRFIQFEKNLNYRPLFIVSITAKIISAIVTVSIAVIYKTYWALIIGTLLSNFIELVLSYFLKPALPRISFSRLKDIFGFTAWLSLANILSSMNRQIDTWITGYFLGIRYAGYYRIGNELTNLPSAEMVAPLTRTFFPAFTTMVDDIKKLRKNALEASSVIAIISLPATFGFAYLAPDVITLLVGEKWLTAVPMLQFITPMIGIMTLTTMGNALCMATGRTALIFKAEVIYFFIRITAMIIGIWFYGFIGLILARAMTDLVKTALNLNLMRLTISSGLFSPLFNAWRSFVSAGIMIAGLWAFDHLIDLGSLTWHPALRTLSLVPFGAGLYIACHMFLWWCVGRPNGAEHRLLITYKDQIRPFFKYKPSSY